MRRSGGAMLYVLILISVMALVMAAYLNVSNAAYKTEVAREREYAANCGLESAILAMTDDYYHGNITISSSPSYTTGAGNVSVNLVDYTATIARTIKATATVAYKGQTYRLTRIVGKRVPNPVPNVYALFDNSNFSGSSAVTTTSATLGGSVYVHGNMTGSTSAIVAGDLEYTGNQNGSVTVSGQTNPNASDLNFPSVNLANYSAVGSILNLLFSILTLNFGSYQTYYFPANSTMYLGGTLSGKGTAAGGSMIINDDVQYTDGSAVAAFVMTKTITVQSNVSTIAGYYYCNGTFTTNGPLTVNGSIACSQLSLGGPLTINYDSRIWTTESLAASLRLPGAYP